MAVLKTSEGFLVESMVLISDALNSATDVLEGAVGLRISQKKPDKKFPYGYYKAENFAARVVSGFICYATVALLFEGYSKLFAPSNITMPLEASGVALISVVVSLFPFKYLRKAGYPETKSKGNGTISVFLYLLKS